MRFDDEEEVVETFSLTTNAYCSGLLLLYYPASIDLIQFDLSLWLEWSTMDTHVKI